MRTSVPPFPLLLCSQILVLIACHLEREKEREKSLVDVTELIDELIFFSISSDWLRVSFETCLEALNLFPFEDVMRRETGNIRYSKKYRKGWCKTHPDPPDQSSLSLPSYFLSVNTTGRQENTALHFTLLSFLSAFDSQRFHVSPQKEIFLFFCL